MFVTRASGDEHERNCSLSSSERDSRKDVAASAKRGSAPITLGEIGRQVEPISQATSINWMARVGPSQGIVPRREAKKDRGSKLGGKREAT